MIFSLQNIILLLGRQKYVFLFPVAVIEGPIITVIAGFLVAQGIMTFLLAFWVIVIGDLVGDSIYYALGRWGRRLFHGRLGLWLGLDGTEKIDNFSEKFKEHGGKTLFVTKFTRGIGVVALITAGAAKFSFLRFLWFNLLGTLPKTLGLLVLGYYFGQAYSQINSYLDYLAFITIIIALAVFFYYLWRGPAPSQQRIRDVKKICSHRNNTSSAAFNAVAIVGFARYIGYANRNCRFKKGFYCSRIEADNFALNNNGFFIS